MSTAINLTIFTILIILTAFFVATEFAIVKLRQSRVDQLVAEGKKNALAAKSVTSHLDEYLSACQLGITVTALGIGMVGESTFEFILHPFFELIGISKDYIHFFTIGGAFVIATFLHVVVGELAPKTIAIQKAEAVTLAFAKPIMLFYKVLYPFIWFLNGAARLLVGLFGMKPASEHELSHTEEELRLLLSESFKSGEINKNELKYVNNVFEFDDKIAREIMVPRTDIIGFEVSATFEEVLTQISEQRYTRYPIFEGDRDNIVGFLNIKDFLTQGLKNRVTVETFKLQDFINPVVNTIESTPIHELLQKMQKERIHIAILLDEYGGTSGMVTVEDILEELVGEIYDEHDEVVEYYTKIDDNNYLVKCDLDIDDFFEHFQIEIDDDFEFNTTSAWVIDMLDKIPDVGDCFEFKNLSILVTDADEKKVNEIKVTINQKEEKEDE